MRRAQIIGVFAAFLSVVALAARAADPEAVSGTWRSKLAMFGDGITFDLVFDGAGTMSISLDPPEFEGLSREDLKTTGKPLRFTWVQDAATLRFTGEGRWLGRPSGTFVLEPNAAYLDQLAAAGLGRPTDRELLRLVLNDVPSDTIVAYHDAGYAGGDFEDLLRLSIHGIDGEFIRGMQALGYRPEIGELIDLRVHGIQPDTAQELARLGLPGIPVRDLIRFRNHGIDPPYLRGMSDAGFPPSDTEGVTRLRMHGLTPEAVAAMRAVEGFALAVEDLVRLTNHGIDADYLAGIAAAKTPGLSVANVVELRNHSVSTDRYCALARAGHNAVDAVITLTHHGVEPRTIEEFAELGYTGLDVKELVDLQVHGVDPDFARRLAEAGHGKLSVRQLIDARIRGEVRT